MRHQHDATTEIYVEEVQRLLERAEDAVTQYRWLDLEWMRPALSR